MLAWVLVALLAVAEGCGGQVAERFALAPGDLWIRNVTVISMERDRPLPNAHVVLSAIRLPLLLLVGERDLITPPESLREPYSRWGGPKSCVVMSRSHHLPFVDEPARFSELVAEFLRRWAGRPAPSAGSRRPVAA